MTQTRETVVYKKGVIINKCMAFECEVIFFLFLMVNIILSILGLIESETQTLVYLLKTKNHYIHTGEE